jgi:hypothetical protein
VSGGSQTAPERRNSLVSPVSYNKDLGNQFSSKWEKNKVSKLSHSTKTFTGTEGRDPLGWTVEPGDSLELDITFAPEDMGDFSDELVITSDDPSGNDSLSIALTGSGIAPVIVIDFEEINFTYVRRDSTAAQVIEIQNTGTDTLHITEMSVETSEFDVDLTSATVNMGESIMVTVTFTPPSVESYTDDLHIFSDAFGASEVTISLSGTGVVPVINVADSELDFGTVRRDSSLTLTFDIENTGSDTLIVSEISITGEVFDVSPLSAQLAPADVQEVSVTFMPTDSVSYEETITIAHDDPDQGEITVDLQAQGVVPEIILSISEMDFDEVLLGLDTLTSMTVTNSGNDALTIDSIATTHESFSVTVLSAARSEGDERSIDHRGKGKQLFVTEDAHTPLFRNMGGADPIVLQPGESLDLQMGFAPTEQGEVEADLVIMSDDPDNLEATVSLSGTGITYPAVNYELTSFGISATQDEEQSFDFVLTNSGDFPLDFSMEVEASWLGIVNWLTVSPESGQIEGNGSQTVTASIENVDQIDAGTFQGEIRVTTNSGPGLTDVTDTLDVTLILLSSGTDIAGGDVTVGSGNQPPVEMEDSDGNSLGVTFDFATSDGGDISVILVPSTPPFDTDTPINDPDGGITDPVFSNFYWEISTTIPEGLVVDVTFSYDGQAGVENPSQLRLAKRDNYAGISEEWDVIPVNELTVDDVNKTVTASNQSDFSQWTVMSDAAENSFQDTQAPTFSGISYSPTEPGVLEPVSVTVSVSDESSLSDVNLFYLVGGESGYSQEAMSHDGSGSYSGEIGGTDVTLTGLAYFIQATDENGLVGSTDTLGIPVNFLANSLTSSISSSPISGGFPKDKWRMISVPAELDDDAAANTIGDEFGVASSNTTWQMFKWTGSSWANASTFEAGESYWLYQMVADNVTFTTGGGRSVDMEGAELTIKSGWNLISSPYAFQVSVDADQGLFHGPISYGLGSEGWSDLISELSPWGGYAIYNRTTSDKTLIVDPTASGGSTARLSDIGADGWLIQLKATAGDYTDEANYVGRLSDATDQLDSYDNPEPPYIDGYVSLAMERPEWGNGLPRFSSDIRSEDEVDGAWDMDLHIRKVTSPVTITPEVHGTLPANFKAVLLDLLSREQADLLTGETVLITDAREDFPYHLKVIAGSPDYVDRVVRETLAALPEKLALNQNYPNPFNPSTRIKFELPQPEKISLKIFNLLGQEVLTLADGWYDLGHYEVVWDGKDASGKGVASGMYISTLTAGDNIITRKMLLLR